MDVRSATQDRSLLDALAVVSGHRHTRRDEVPGDLDLGFASQRWQAFVAKPPVRARHLRPACARGVRVRPPRRRPAGRRSLRRGRGGLRRLPRPAPAVGGVRGAAAGLPRRPRHPRTGRGLRGRAEGELAALAAEVDAGFPDQHRAQPRRRRHATPEASAAAGQPEGLAEFEQEARARMPERHMLDILRHVEHWARYTRHFGPPSGSDPKLAQAERRYLLTVFGYGCNLGPSQTARHAPEVATRAGAAPDQRPAHHRRQAGSGDGRRHRPIRPLPAAPALGWRPRRDRRRHPRQAAREQPARLAAHPLRRLRRHRLPPHRRHLHRPVHQLHPLRRLGGRPHPGRAAEEPLRDPARHDSRRHPGAKRGGLRPVPAPRHQADAAHARPGRRDVLPPVQATRYRHIDALFGGRDRLGADRGPLRGTCSRSCSRSRPGG